MKTATSVSPASNVVPMTAAKPAAIPSNYGEVPVNYTIHNHRIDLTVKEGVKLGASVVGGGLVTWLIVDKGIGLVSLGLAKLWHLATDKSK